MIDLSQRDKIYDGTLHKFIQGGHHIVLDVNSGAVHVVDKLIYDMLDVLRPPLGEICPDPVFERFPDVPHDDLADCYGELYHLFTDGVLYSSEGYEAYADHSVKAPVKALCLHVSHDCNLRCAYCFAGTGDFGGGRMLMEPEVGRLAIDFLVNESGERENLEVDFFGGEPLMAWDTVVETVRYARSLENAAGKHFRFTLTTNGVLLDDEKISFINSEMSNVVLSLDGRREVNDRVRKTVSGKGSYDLILPKFKKLVEIRVTPGRTDYYVRGTFTGWNLDFTEDIEAMAAEGFYHLSVEPAVTAADVPYAITPLQVDRIKDEYDRLFEIMRNDRDDKRYSFFHFNIDLNQGPCAIKRLRGCGAGNEYVAIAPDGDIFPCHQFVGIDEWKMGSLFEAGGALDFRIKEQFAATHIYSKEECPTCWARFYCSGGCNAAGFLYEGDIRKPHGISCALMKKRIECGIALRCDSN